MVKTFSENEAQQKLLGAVKQVAKVTPFLNPAHLGDMLEGVLDGYCEGHITSDATDTINFKNKKTGDPQEIAVIEAIIDDKDYKISFNGIHRDALDNLLAEGGRNILVSHHNVDGKFMPGAYDITFLNAKGEVALVKVTSKAEVTEPGSNFDVRGMHWKK